jgi:uncharacterized protein with NRDE domain
MCLVALAIDQHRRFPLVIAANRDEYFDRPTARLAWWQPRSLGADTAAGTGILGGRDLKEGGTWLGLTQAGRLALVTNVRAPGRTDPAAPSRGHIVPMWLTSTRSADQRWVQLAMSGHNPFNLVAADFPSGECWWASSQRTIPVRLPRGLYGLSNGALDAPWPKVRKLKQHMARLLTATEASSGATAGPGAFDMLVSELFAALSDRDTAADADLPETGVGLELERVLSPVFVRTADGRYGTRCSTLVITERTGRSFTTHVLERSFPSAVGLALLRHVTLPGWPPRAAAAPAAAQPDAGAPQAEPHRS